MSSKILVYILLIIKQKIFSQYDIRINMYLLVYYEQMYYLSLHVESVMCTLGLTKCKHAADIYTSTFACVCVVCVSVVSVCCVCVLCVCVCVCIGT